MKIDELKTKAEVLVKAYDEDPAFKKKVDEAVQGVAVLVVTSRHLVKAAKAARRGNYPEAVYHLMLWRGISGNFNQSKLIEALREAKPSSRFLPPTPRPVQQNHFFN